MQFIYLTCLFFLFFICVSQYLYLLPFFIPSFLFLISSFTYFITPNLFLFTSLSLHLPLFFYLLAQNLFPLPNFPLPSCFPIPSSTCLCFPTCLGQHFFPPLFPSLAGKLIPFPSFLLDYYLFPSIFSYLPTYLSLPLSCWLVSCLSPLACCLYPHPHTLHSTHCKSYRRLAARLIVLILLQYL